MAVDYGASLVQGSAGAKRKKKKKWAAKAVAFIILGLCRKDEHAMSGSCDADETQYLIGGTGGSQEWCQTTCGANAGLKHYPYNCMQYCTVDDEAHLKNEGFWYRHFSSVCASKKTDIAFAFSNVMINFFPGGKGLKVLKDVSKRGMMVAIKKAAKTLANKVRKQAKGLLKTYLRDMRDELVDEVLDGGADINTATLIFKDSTYDLGAAAHQASKELMNEMSFGVIELVQAFEAPQCSDKMLPEIPASDD